MKSRRRLFFAAAILIAAVGGGIYTVRHFKKGEKATPEKAPEEERRTKEEAAIARGSFERRAVNQFANSLRQVFEWRKQQRGDSPASRATLVKTVAEKFKTLPTADLPKDFADAWADVLGAWQELATQQPASPELVQRGKKAAERMNNQLRAAGYGDLTL